MTRHHRRCTMCYTEYTPQWRRSRHTGGYLCNACGTRELREAQKMPGFQSRRVKKRSSCGSETKHTPVKRSSYGHQLAYTNLLCDSDSYKDLQMILTPMSSSGTSSATQPYEVVDTDHANHEVFATWIVMMRFESDVRMADEIVDAHPCYSGLSVLWNLEPNMEYEHLHSFNQIKHLMESAVQLSRAVSSNRPIDVQHFECMKSKYRSSLDEVLCREVI
eukprot:TRINITY_DN3557_c0_g1_i2.p1 TRINITY_DN3557_c0_g1~~TRINITY_DN3557_c0_g1_i2.p1  ORF type:complete len:219 (+),score=11.99 TRINITY_DN3557_c0_g1_i2:260-916(+)